MFDLETGKMDNDSIGVGAWRNMNPSPKGTWRRVRVDARGFVREGLEDNLDIKARLFRAVFDDTIGHSETERGFVDLSPTTTFSADEEWAEYRWVVPEKVERIKVLMSGAGGGYDEDGDVVGADGNVIEFAWTVVPGERLRIKVGLGAQASETASVRSVSETHIESDDATRRVWTAGGASISQFPASSVVGNYRSKASVGPYGLGGQATGQAGQGGLVILEWYA